MLIICIILFCSSIVYTIFTFNAAKVGIFLKPQKKKVSFLMKKVTFFIFYHTNSIFLSSYPTRVHNYICKQVGVIYYREVLLIDQIVVSSPPKVKR